MSTPEVIVRSPAVTSRFPIENSFLSYHGLSTWMQLPSKSLVPLLGHAQCDNLGNYVQLHLGWSSFSAHVKTQKS